MNNLSKIPGRCSLSVGLARYFRMSMLWFENLTGFSEENASQVHKLLSLDEASFTLTSSVNGREMACGRLTTPTLKELRSDFREGDTSAQKMKVSTVIAGVEQLHSDPENARAFFQVASQFNLLEMVDPSITPEHGISRYALDRTQGPACAISAGAGTIYRNYFVPVRGQIGQSADNQLDVAADLAAAFETSRSRPWRMTNGYALATRGGLKRISEHLEQSSEMERDRLRQLLRIGVQYDTEVTLPNCGHKVTQAFCSALPVAYCEHPVNAWEEAARLVLEASYEATLCAAIRNFQLTGNNRTFLTFIGGGAFGNRMGWILDAMDRALSLYKHWPLDVQLVCLKAPEERVESLVRRYAL
jgi:hypothetical protein